MRAFSNWGGELSGAINPQTIAMDADHTVSANFVIDTQPPVIENIQVTPGPSSATIEWTTDELADSRVDYNDTGCVDSCTPPGSGLLLSYGFDQGVLDQIVDVSGLDRDGTLVSGAVRSGSGYFGSAVEFNGGPGHVDLANLDLGGSGLTILMWVRFDDFDVADARLISTPIRFSSGIPFYSHGEAAHCSRIVACPTVFVCYSGCTVFNLHKAN